MRNVGTVFAAGGNEDERQLKGIFVDKLDIQGSGVVAIMGPSGSGKSTLFSLMSGLKGINLVSSNPEDSCLELFRGTDSACDLLAGQTIQPGTLGFVFQDAHLMKTLSVSLNVDMARALTKPRLDEARFQDLMNSFGLGFSDTNKTDQNLSRTRLSNLSGGQQQRVAVARAIAAEPQVIFCDEPTSNLDPVNARRIMKHLSDWAEANGALVLWVTHDETLALEIASSILYVNNGQLVSEDGRPLVLEPLEPGDDSNLEPRRAQLAALKLQNSDAPLSEDHCKAQNLIIDPNKTERRRSNSNRLNKQSKPHITNFMGTLAFLWQFVLAELFQGKPVSGVRRGRAGRLAHRFWRGPLVFTRPTFALIVMLGIMASYAMIVGLNVLSAKFERDLRKPEVSHYTLNLFGDVDSAADDLLSDKSLRRMQAELGKTFVSVEGVRELQIFGRRLELSTRVAALEAGCDGARQRARSAVLVVFDHKEPLFQETATISGQPIGNWKRKDLRGQVFVTRDFLNRALGVAPEDPTPEAFCLGTEKALARVDVAGILPDIPGSKVLSGEVAMTNEAYLRLLNTKEMRPANWGKNWPPYESAAMYFDANYAADLFCMIDECEEKPELFHAKYGPSFKLNDDALGQVKSLLGIALNSKLLVVSAVVAMALSIVISEILSVQAFIVSHERFLSIMRAVGYRFFHVSFLVFLELLVITLVAAVATLFLLYAFHVLWAPTLALQWELPADWLAWSTAHFLLSVSLAFGLVIVVGICVVAVWWSNHRYVGSKLQSV
ncbi:Methionine import ATP-binding protein MetN [Pelagimonas phthalicica]|uniref:Methionine import ATP-binding protein MetN n=1 Tax=Pelagimonas phthalicica TaxID=1037362 RepID=A0A238JHR0_9RHOB|nr:ATP-binding cassette domain-containing protein [Pelagimonas phthalicica]TDS92431.1 ABC-type lipoprotein export system ATPase subunit [Pelagimonas phthalicica]SMX29492.1 Methionine import ATP-binding protein MetN [Pelagimonas phthalicica]